MKIERSKKKIIILISILLLAQAVIQSRVQFLRSCTVTANASKNELIINLEYYQTDRTGVEQTDIHLDLPLGRLVDFPSLCENVHSNFHTFYGCDDSNPYILTLDHEDVFYQNTTIDLQGFNFPPEGQSFPAGSVQLSGKAGRDYVALQCGAFSSPPYTGIYIYIYIYGVVVKKSELIAHIKGSNQNIPINFGFELDAQGSFDPDNRNKTDALTYTWTCQEILPNTGEECQQKDGNNLSSVLKSEAKIEIPKDIFTSGVEMRFSILVKENPYPKINPRSASESAIITTQPTGTFLITILESGKSAPAKFYSPNLGLNLYAMITQSTYDTTQYQD